MVTGLAGNRCATDGCVRTARQKKLLRIERKPPIVSLLDFLFAAVHSGEASGGDCLAAVPSLHRSTMPSARRHAATVICAHRRAARAGVPLCCARMYFT